MGCRSFYSGKNIVFDNFHQCVQFFLGGVPAEGDTEGAVNNLRGQIHGGHHMAAVTLGTGAAGADTDTGILQNVDGVLRGHAGNGQGKDMGGFMSAVDPDTFQPGELCDAAVQQRLFPLDIRLECGRHGGAGSGEAENGGGSFGAAAQIAFLPAA